MLGQSKINMVLRYAHPTARHQAQAMQRLENGVADQRGASPGASLLPDRRAARRYKHCRGPALLSVLPRDVLFEDHRHRIAWSAANDVEDFGFHR